MQYGEDQLFYLLFICWGSLDNWIPVEKGHSGPTVLQVLWKCSGKEDFKLVQNAIKVKCSCDSS
jgi:hypothetical protein